MDFIKDVALYLRKSRGEEDTDLDKHRLILAEIAIKNNWRYIEYVEIASSDTIAYRPKFKSLLKDIEEGLFDAVLVVDYDRLGRGDLEDQAIIKRIFRESETMIYDAAHGKLYDLSDDSDDLTVDVKGLLARQEYKAIKRRLLRGKKTGARQGNWTNGTPPFPYKYDTANKGLVVDETNRQIYFDMKTMFLNGKPFYEIAWFLNNKKIPSPKGGVWHENTIRRILRDETHLGRIISNKTEGSGHKNKKTKELKQFPRDEWIIVENCHEILKTEEEHREMLSISAARTKFHPSARRGAFILSGLIYCKKCAKAMQMQNKANSVVLIKPCTKADHFGNRCSNKGMKIDNLLELLKIDLKKQSVYIGEQEEQSVDHIVHYRDLIKSKEKEIDKIKGAIEKIREMYEEGDYTKEEYMSRLNKRKSDLNQVESDLQNYQLIIEKQEAMTNLERSKKLNHIVEIIDDPNYSVELKNQLLKQVIDQIIYLREDTVSPFEIDVKYL